MTTVVFGATVTHQVGAVLPVVGKAQLSHATAISAVAFPVREATMRLDHKPLRDQIADASSELKLARRDGSAEWIERAERDLNELIELIPKSARQEIA